MMTKNVEDDEGLFDLVNFDSGMFTTITGCNLDLRREELHQELRAKKDAETASKSFADESF